MPEAADRPIPPLRADLEAVPIEHEGETAFYLRDLEEIATRSVALSPGGLLLASLFDGRRSASELQGALMTRGGALLDPGEILKLASDLEEAGLLETGAVAAKRQEALEAFKKSPVRKPALAGASYPEDTLELSKWLGSFYRDPKGPGKAPPERPSGKAPVGLIAPHIDWHRGGPAYAWAYGALAEREPPDAIVALGVAHASPASPWAMTRKAYETPFGPMAVHDGLYKDIAAALWYDPAADEEAHRREHSLEFQAVWLRFLWRERTPPWVPILCSSFERFCPDKPPSSAPSVEKALERIGETLKRRAEEGLRILVLAGVDFAHVGPRFGDQVQLGPEVERRIESEDRRSLERATALDADGFYAATVADGHWRKVCGLSATYTAARWIKALGASQGRLLAYGQAPDPSGGIVSFASAIYDHEVTR